MAVSLRASQQGLEIVDLARRKKGWTKTAFAWCDLANTTPATLKKFWRGLPIQQDVFINICKAVGLDNWEDMIDFDDIRPKQPTSRIVSLFSYDDCWVGREELITQLSQKLRGSCRILILTGITGIGKTALAEKLVMELQSDWTKFDRVNIEEGVRVSDFASVADRLLSSWGETLTSDDRQKPQILLNRLVKHLREHRYLLLIDSLEQILKGNEETGWNDFEDEWWASFFKSFLSAESCQSRVILTSQDLPVQLMVAGSRYQNFWYCQSLRGLTKQEQLALFEKTGLEVGEKSSGRTYLERIGAAYEGHPLALRVIAGEITNKPFDGNVVAYWQKYGHEIEELEKSLQQVEIQSADEQLNLDRFTRSLRKFVRSRLEETFNRLQRDSYNAYLLLCSASVYRTAVPEKWWLNHLEDWDNNEEQRMVALDLLRDRYLVEEEVIQDRVYLRQHNLIRSVALSHLKKLDNSE